MNSTNEPFKLIPDQFSNFVDILSVSPTIQHLSDGEEILSLDLPPLWSELTSPKQTAPTLFIQTDRKHSIRGFHRGQQKAHVVMQRHFLHCTFDIRCNFQDDPKLSKRCEQFVRSCFRDVKRCFQFTYASVDQFKVGRPMNKKMRCRDKDGWWWE